MDKPLTDIIIEYLQKSIQNYGLTKTATYFEIAPSTLSSIISRQSISGSTMDKIYVKHPEWFNGQAIKPQTGPVAEA